ncbi:stage V sporulation protein AA [Bacillus infantis]|jgi:stage V sporulation protein AA|uniref:stage V sporulation protein AA n=1 Tax=Bacillus infantis TaxID=324767 RepID=UPI003CF08DC5
MEKTVYVRLRNRIQVRPQASVQLKDIALIIADETLYERLGNLSIHHVSDHDRNIIVIDIVQVIQAIAAEKLQLDIQAVGPSQTIIEVIYKKKKASTAFFLLIWFLLFFGAALTIMNFHEDVSMQTVHQRIYTIITGKVEKKPLLFQIPYSIGLGLGMIIFFNHVFKKRLNEEPSPLEVEMFNYQQDLDRYVIMHENKESMKNLDDH